MAPTSMTLGEPRDPRRSPAGRLLRAALVGLAALALAFLLLLAFRAGSAPAVVVEPALPGIGPATPVTVHLTGGSRGLAPVRVQLVQGERTVELAEAHSTPRPAWALWGGGEAAETLRFEVGHRSIDGLQQGEATIRVVAERPASWFRSPPPAVTEVTLPVRLTPPAVAVLSRQHYVTQGGSGAVVFRVGDGAAASGVRAGDAYFPSHPLPGGGAGERFALFAVPYDLDDPEQVRLVAQDELGNVARLPFLDGFRRRPPARDDIRLSEAFMARVVPEIVAHTPGFPDQGGLLPNYLYINGELREQNRARVAELAAASRPEFLWTRPFRAMPNAAVMATFATHRDYWLDGEKVDEAFHLGYDLASVRQDAVPAANRGVVVLAEYLGIYGNAVVIDHGYGLVSLYGHLSSIGVEAGVTVEGGQELGRTGETGLAGGDHLHFGMFLQGVAVEPKEWWDPGWLRDRIAPKLGDAWDFRE